MRRSQRVHMLKSVYCKKEGGREIHQIVLVNDKLDEFVYLHVVTNTVYDKDFESHCICKVL